MWQLFCLWPTIDVSVVPSLIYNVLIANLWRYFELELLEHGKCIFWSKMTYFALHRWFVINMYFALHLCITVGKLLTSADSLCHLENGDAFSNVPVSCVQLLISLCQRLLCCVFIIENLLKIVFNSAGLAMVHQCQGPLGWVAPEYENCSSELLQLTFHRKSCFQVRSSSGFLVIWWWWILVRDRSRRIKAYSKVEEIVAFLDHPVTAWKSSELPHKRPAGLPNNLGRIEEVESFDENPYYWQHTHRHLPGKLQTRWRAISHHVTCH